MIKSALLLICLCFSTLILSGYDLKNPALNPVKFTSSPEHSPLKFIENGKINFAIVANFTSEGKQPHPELSSITQAANVMKKIISKASGCEIEVFASEHLEEAMKKYPYVIVLGTTALNKDYNVSPEKAGREGFIVKTFPHGIIISGNDFLNPAKRPLRGTLWGAFDVLERIFSCRFYFPGEYGSYIPDLKNLTVEPAAYTDAPHFRNRSWEWWLWALDTTDPALRSELERLIGTNVNIRDFTNSQRLEITDNFWVGHNPDPERFTKSYPDKVNFFFYRAPNGNFYHNQQQHIGNYWDTTNLQLADFFMESLKKYEASSGEKNDGWNQLSDEYISFGQCDSDVPTGDMVNHPVVKREHLLTEQHLKSKYPYGDLNVRFWKYFAEAAQKEFPEKKVIFLPYSNCTTAPINKDLKLPGNAELRLCVYDFPGWLGNPKIEEEWKTIIKNWSEVLNGRPIASLWLYNVRGNPFARAIVPQMLGRIPRLLGPLLGNEDLFLDQDNLNFKDSILFFYYAHYAAHRAMWNPDFNVQAALDEHWKLFYGEKAGAYLKEFHALLLQLHMNVFVPKPDDRWPVYPPAAVNHLEALLKQAEAAIPKDTVEWKRFCIFAYPWPDAFASQKKRSTYLRPLYGAYQLLNSEKVQIDGKTEEDFYPKMKKMPLQDAQGNNTVIKFPSDVRIFWGKDGIYGAISSPWPSDADKNKSLWENSNVEIFISPGSTKKNYFHYAVDALNQTYFGTRELKPVNKPYDGNWKSPGFHSAAINNAQDWTLEFFIPYADLFTGTPKAYDCWYINIVVNKKSIPAEWSSSSMTVGQNHNLEHYGIIKFMGKGE